MSKKVQLQRVDGELRITLPSDITPKDFENWLNNTPDKPQLEFEELPERWTSAEDYSEEP